MRALDVIFVFRCGDFLPSAFTGWGIIMNNKVKINIRWRMTTSYYNIKINETE